MGVQSLWQIVHPCARPIKLETLNRKRLAVDASIWIYQFLKAVRDKEGNALRNSHVVGFFRRICKLLFFGIKPVFVFDGGAPVLKRQTVSERKKRREGRREDAVRTAGRLLAVQMQRRAEEEEQNRRAQPQQEEVIPDEGLVYADENLMSQQERQQNRKFRKKDAYHLPDLDVSMSEMGGPNDPRVMSLEELQAYAKQFETGEDINVYDFSKIDFDSSFFVSLPASDRYNILNAARLRSRLRMGHSKEQLDTMFPDRMEFSRFQIERVTERNELTQRLMHVNEGGDTYSGQGGRVAGEKGREYVLVKNDGVEGGWALGVISDEGTRQETAIDLDKPAPAVKREDEEWEDEDDFEDVPIEGLNRLPKRPKGDAGAEDAFTKQRRAFYKSRKAGARRKAKPVDDPNALFVAEESAEDDGEEWEGVNGNNDLFGEGARDDEEDGELQRAIAMSLEQDGHGASQSEQASRVEHQSEPEEEDMVDVFHQSAAPESLPVPKGSGRAIANIVNKRAFDVAPESREFTSFGVPAPKPDDDVGGANEQEDDSMDFQAALAESRRTKRHSSPPRERQASPSKREVPTTEVAKKAGFSGPLPFEKLDLGSSLLGKKKMQERTEEAAGGFENPELTQKAQQKSTGPLPPWFSGSLDEDMQKQKELESEDREQARQFNKQFQFQGRHEPRLRRGDTNEVIDLEAEESHGDVRNQEVVDLEADEGQKDFRNGEIIDLEAEDMGVDHADQSLSLYDPKIRMGDQADKVRVEPPIGGQKDHPIASPPKTAESAPFEVDEDDDEDGEEAVHEHRSDTGIAAKPTSGSKEHVADQDEEMIDWSESEDEATESKAQASQPIEPPDQRVPSRSPSVEFEDVGIPDKPASPPHEQGAEVQENFNVEGPAPASGFVQQEGLQDEAEDVEFDDFSDPEDEELLRQLAQEAEEHARFASTLNNKTQAQNVADYEKELKQLRNQQQKDRRDADEVTQTMILECQQLLRLFGLPYVTAPMEAEAQCAELVKLGLVDGIVTDDSDCFLFGGTRVYKNMFNQAKIVECYLTSDMEKEFSLTRDKLIQVAQLLGSDYTEGLQGVGPVTAVELVGEFSTLDEFKKWWDGVQMNSIPKSVDADNPIRKKFRKNTTKLFLPATFPDPRVQKAYEEPEVDSDPEQFQWGVPDLDALRSFLMATIGWSQERTDEVLVPVIRDMNRRIDEGTQANITAFFDGGVGIGAAGATKSSARGEAFPKRVAESSKRMGSALTRMAERAKLDRNPTRGNEHDHAEDGVTAEGRPNGNFTVQREPVKKTTKAKKRAKPNDHASMTDEGSEFDEPKKKSKKRTTSGKGTRGRKKNT